MKIGSHIKPRDGGPRIVPIHGREYTFAPLKDTQGVTHLVADVHDPAHAELFLRNGAFYAFDPSKAAQTKLKRGEPDKPAEAPPSTEPAWPAAIIEEAAALLDAPASDIATAIGKVSGLDVVRCAAALEAKGKARKGVLGLLETTLQAAAEAGVKA